MPTVLLVEDSPVTRRVLSQRFEIAGFDVRSEPTATAARTVDPSTLACAVVDIELPDGLGLDVAGELLRRRPSLPLAFFTAGTSAAALEGARARGPVFIKPGIDALIAWAQTAFQPPPTK